MRSVRQMLEKVEGLVGTGDLSRWEEEFVESLVSRREQGDTLTDLSAKQVEVLDRLHGKHFA